VENPIWKTSYRLVLDKQKKSAPYLQGWAVVENPTDEDWKDVRMALVSGRPISFQMDLYTPLNVPRPVVEPELFASLRPVAYSGGRTNVSPTGLVTNSILYREEPRPNTYVQSKESRDEMVRRGLNCAENEGEPAKRLKDLDERMDLGKTAVSVAQAAKLG